MSAKPLLVLIACVALLATTACGDDPAPSDGSGDQQSELFDYDPGRPLALRERERPRQPRTVDVRFTTFDGERVPATLTIPRGQAPHTCVIFQGGLGSVLTKDASEDYAPLVGLGYAVLSIQTRFGGEREVDGIDALEAAKDPELLRRMLTGSVIDLRRALDYLEQWGDCERKIGYVGASFGGFLGALLAGVDDRVSAAALIVTGADWRKLFECSDIGFLPGIENHPLRLAAALDLLRPLDPAQWVGLISPRPVLIVNARDDSIICPVAARALQEAAGEPKDILWVPGEHNPFANPAARRVMAKALVEFLRLEL